MTWPHGSRAVDGDLGGLDHEGDPGPGARSRSATARGVTSADSSPARTRMCPPCGSRSVIVTVQRVARAAARSGEEDRDRGRPEDGDGRARPARARRRRRRPTIRSPVGVSTAWSRQVPRTRLSPAMRAAKVLRGRDSTSALGPSSTTLPSSSTTTRSASSRASSTSWVTRTAVRSASTRRSVCRSGGRDRDVEGGQRLVEQQQPRVGGERPGHGDPLGLAAGELAGPASGEARAARPRPASGRRRSCAVARGRTAAAGAEGDVVAHGQVREQQRLLREQRDPAVVRRAPHVARRSRRGGSAPVRRA